MNPRLIEKVLGDYFPAGERERGVTYEVLPDTVVIDEDWVFATTRLICWEKEELRDVKEQRVRIAHRRHLDDLERYREYLKSVRDWIMASRRQDVECFLPEEFFDIVLLDATKAASSTDFEEARNPPLLRVSAPLAINFVGAVTRVAFSPDGQQLAVYGHNELCLVDLRQRRARWTKKMYASDFVFSADSASLHVLQGAYPLRLDVEDGAELFQSDTSAQAVAANEEGVFYFVHRQADDAEEMVSELILYRGEPLQEVARMGGPYLRCFPTIDRSAGMAVLFDECTLYGWDLQGACQRFELPIESVVRAIVSDDARLVGIKSYGWFSLVDARDGESYTAIPHPGGVDAMAFSADGRYFALGGSSTVSLPEARVYKIVWIGEDRASMHPVCRVATQHGAEITATALSPDGTTLVTASRDGTVELHTLQV